MHFVPKTWAKVLNEHCVLGTITYRPRCRQGSARNNTRKKVFDFFGQMSALVSYKRFQWWCKSITIEHFDPRHDPFLVFFQIIDQTPDELGRREGYWQHELMTLLPWGLNTRDELNGGMDISVKNPRHSAAVWNYSLSNILLYKLSSS